jgi:hypothetical protein
LGGVAALEQAVKALSPKKVARSLQIENKIRALVRYELREEMPLIP